MSAAVLEDSPGLSRAHGLDLDRWLEEDLVDILASGGNSICPISELIELGHMYDAPVWVNVNRALRRFRRENPAHGRTEGYRAQALNAWRAGADGVRVFNLFPERPEDCEMRIFSELGEPALLARLNTFHCLDHYGTRLSEASYGPAGACSHYRGYAEHIARPVIGPWNPKTLEPGTAYRWPLYVGDTLTAGVTTESSSSPAEGDSMDPRVLLCLSFEKPTDGLEVQVALNGVVLDPIRRRGEELFALVKPDVMRSGHNLLRVEAVSSEEAVLTDVKIEISHGGKEFLSAEAARAQ